MLAGFGLLIFLALFLLFATFETVPTRNGKLTHFDTILVLGCPALLNGQPSPEERERVTEAVKEFKAGRAGHMIISGGARENQFIEGRVMAAVAEDQGVPAADIVVEGQAQNTIQNIYFSNQIMQQKGWTSAEIVSSPSHLPRAGLILEHFRFQWKEHASHWPPEYSWREIGMIYAGEIAETWVLRWRGFSPSPFLPLHYTS
ncbi:MAG: YdcF family protein [Acidobacteriota bacterium]|nr:YdcF family protein [Acidobacteriota bacterium]